MVLSTREKKELLSLAHFSIQSGFQSHNEEKIQEDKSDILKSKSGAFVTIKINGKLRGCIGYVQSNTELITTIMDAAYQAAFCDPRFSPLNEDELENIKLEISILSEASPLKSYEDIILGQHGLILEDSGQSGLLLPQVPIEHNMSKEAYLSALCNKAGFHEDYWKEKQLQIKYFTATVFSETDEDLK